MLADTTGPEAQALAPGSAFSNWAPATHRQDLAGIPRFWRKPGTARSHCRRQGMNQGSPAGFLFLCLPPMPSSSLLLRKLFTKEKKEKHIS